MKRVRDARNRFARLVLRAITDRTVRRLTALATTVAVLGVGFVQPAAAHAEDVGTTGQVVRLQARHSGKCLDIAGSHDGAPVIQYSCQDIAGQRWDIRPHEGVFAKVVNQYTGFCLDVSGSSKQARAGVIQRSCNSMASQQWAFDHVGDGFYLIWSRNSGLCLDVYRSDPNNWAPIIQFPCVDPPHPAQQFLKL